MTEPRRTKHIRRTKPDREPRKPLRDMTAAEFRDWLAEQQAELEDFCSFAQDSLKGRERRGLYTRTDERYQQFLERAADLIAGLDEMRQQAEQAAQEERE